MRWCGVDVDTRQLEVGPYGGVVLMFMLANLKWVRVVMWCLVILAG